MKPHRYFVLFLTLARLGVQVYSSGLQNDVDIDLKQIIVNIDDSITLPHFWETGVGSGNAELTTRMDWREHLAIARRELGFNYVRYHGVFNDGHMYFNAPLNDENPSYFNAISTYSYLLSIGMKPVVELSFTPSPVNSGKCNHFYYASCETIPNNFTRYSSIVKDFVQTLVDYYGLDEVRSWYFEVYNEADLHWKFEDYFLLYKAASLAVISVDADLKVGGPASAFPAWIQKLMKACEMEHVPLHFVSSHAYPTTGGARPAELKGLMAQVSKARENAGKNIPLFITEWNGVVDSRGQWHDEPDAAAFIVASISTVAQEIDPLPEIFAYWAVSDVFIEQGLPAQSVPFHGGFGLLNLFSIPKPAYRAFELLHTSGKQMMKHRITANHGYVEENLPYVDSEIVLYTRDDSLCPSTGQHMNAKIWRIDADNTNPLRIWKEMGSHNYLKSNMIKRLKEASELKYKSINMDSFSNSSGCFIRGEVQIPPFGLAVLEIQIQLFSARTSDTSFTM